MMIPARDADRGSHQSESAWHCCVDEFQSRRNASDSFFTKVLASEHMVLVGDVHEEISRHPRANTPG